LANLVLFILGGLLTLSYSPFDIWLMPFIAFPILFTAFVNSPNAKQAAKYGFIFGLGWFMFGLSWVHNAIADFGGLPLVFSLLLMFLLTAYLALYPALIGWLTYKLQPKFGWLVILPIWLCVEYLRSVVFTGFPWLSIGYGQLNNSLSGYVPIVGEFGLQAIIILLICLLLLVLNVKTKGDNLKRNTQHKRIALFSIVVIFVVGQLLTKYQWSEDNGKNVNLALVQGNIEQSIKWQPENEVPTMVKYYKLSTPYWNSADIIIWPEAAIPRLEVSSNDYLMDVDKAAVNSNTALITGIVDYQPDTHYAFNNVIVLGKKNKLDKTGHYQYLHNNRYSKHHLLPFGEYVPFERLLRKLAPIFDLPFSSFNRGRYQQDNLVANSVNITSAICFEIAFPQQVSANITDNSDFILTLSNDAWFGNSHGPWQHLQIAQMRALEFAMPVVRVTNNGVTAVIDSKGKIVSSLLQNTEQVLEYKLALSSSHSFYKRFGNLTTWLLMLLLIVFLLIRYKRATPRAELTA